MPSAGLMLEWDDWDDHPNCWQFHPKPWDDRLQWPWDGRLCSAILVVFVMARPGKSQLTLLLGWRWFYEDDDKSCGCSAIPASSGVCA